MPAISPLAVSRPELGAYADINPPVGGNEAQRGTGKQAQKQWLDALVLFKNGKKGERRHTELPGGSEGVGGKAGSTRDRRVEHREGNKMRVRGSQEPKEQD